MVTLVRMLTRTTDGKLGLGLLPPHHSNGTRTPLRVYTVMPNSLRFGSAFKPALNLHASYQSLGFRSSFIQRGRMEKIRGEGVVDELPALDRYSRRLAIFEDTQVNYRGRTIFPDNLGE